jgi:aconitate hydratase 2/2-methylisocitrate dehydratase
MGKDAQVFLASAELAAIASILGRLPTTTEYFERMATVDALSADIYRYLQFDALPGYARAETGAA